MNKNFLRYVAVFCFIFTFLGICNISAEEEMTRGQFLKHLAESMGLTSRLGANPQMEDYLNALRGTGMDIADNYDTNVAISRAEKAEFLSQALTTEREAGETAKEITPANRDKATIIKVTGTVTIKRQNENNWIPAAIDMQLAQGDYIKTGPESTASLRVGMVGRVEIKQNSELNLQSLSTQADNRSENISVYLEMGEIFVDVKGLSAKSKFETHTPTTLAAVRGTTYSVKVESPQGKTEVRDQAK